VAADAIQQRIQRELDALRNASQFRTLECITGVNLSSNDYLGLADDPRLKQAVAEAVERAPAVGSTGSRLLSGNSPEWESLEENFAEFAGTEAALYFGSGYAANIGLLSSVLGSGDLVFSDAFNHASLIDGIRLCRATKTVYPHRDLQFLERALRDHAGEPGARIIVTESIFSMEGDIAPIGELVQLARKYSADLVLDEAHATGVCGPRGGGLAAQLNAQREILAIVHTCGKALASAGAFVCGSRALKDYLVNRARTFIFNTAMPPYLAGQIKAALDLAREADDRRARLSEISNTLCVALAAAGLNIGTSATHIVPVIFGSNESALHAASELQRNGFAVRAIRPPTVPAGTARIRISLTSKITDDEVRRLIAVLTRFATGQAAASPATAVHA
jgi:8-amino-7-oxononanoate synthase